MLNKAMEAKARELGVQTHRQRRPAQRRNARCSRSKASSPRRWTRSSSTRARWRPARRPSTRPWPRGIPIVNVNSETRSAPTAFVGSRDEESARIAMEYIAKPLERPGQRRDDARLHGPGRADQARPGRARSAGQAPRAEAARRSDRRVGPRQGHDADGELDPVLRHAASTPSSRRTTRWAWAR